VAVSVNGEKVRELREAKLLERQELADLAGISYTTIYKMERHGHLPRLSTVRAVAKVLKVKPEEIVTGSPVVVAN
jgi:DNA-binding XRE family transcriptional regulator